MNKHKKMEAYAEAEKILIARHLKEFNIIFKEKLREVEKHGGILK